MDKIKIHVLRTGEVRVSPYLPFGGDDCSLLKASGITTPKSKWIWLPVFSFLIEHPKGMMAASPDGEGFKAKFEHFQIKHLPDQRRLEWLEKHK